MQTEIQLTIKVMVRFDREPTEQELASVTSDIAEKLLPAAMEVSGEAWRPTFDGTNQYKVKGAQLVVK